MAAPRASSFKALQNLSRATRPTPAHSRGLHITGIHASPARIDPTHKSMWTPLGLQDLRNECRKRTLTVSGTKPELIDRLAAHDSLQARAFSMAMRRISQQSTQKAVSGPADVAPHRSFNTSRVNKAVNDSSTIDFAYLPSLSHADFEPQPAAIRIPILPHIESDHAEATLDKFPELDAAAGGYQDTNAGVSIMKPEISKVDSSIVTNFSVMSDVHDGDSREMTVEVLSKLTETVAHASRQFVDIVKDVKDKDEATIRKIWSGFLDDLFGGAKPVAKA